MTSQGGVASLLMLLDISLTEPLTVLPSCFQAMIEAVAISVSSSAYSIGRRRATHRLLILAYRTDNTSLLPRISERIM